MFEMFPILFPITLFLLEFHVFRSSQVCSLFFSEFHRFEFCTFLILSMCDRRSKIAGRCSQESSDPQAGAPKLESFRGAPAKTLKFWGLGSKIEDRRLQGGVRRNLRTREQAPQNFKVLGAPTQKL